jgi:hypothetical protein
VELSSALDIPFEVEDVRVVGLDCCTVDALTCQERDTIRHLITDLWLLALERAVPGRRQDTLLAHLG